MTREASARSLKISISLVIFSTGFDVPTQPNDLCPAAERHCSLQFTVRSTTAISNIQEHLNKRY